MVNASVHLKLNSARECQLTNLPLHLKIAPSTEISVVRSTKTGNNAEELPEFGEGSGFNMKKREEIAALKYKSTKPVAENNELELINGDSKKTFKLVSQGAFNDNSDYFVLHQRDANNFDMIPIDKWFKGKPIVPFKPLSSDQAEEHFAKTADHMSKISQKIQNKYQNIYEQGTEQNAGVSSSILVSASNVQTKNKPKISSKPTNEDKHNYNSDPEEDIKSDYADSEDDETNEKDPENTVQENNEDKGSDENSENDDDNLDLSDNSDNSAPSDDSSIDDESIKEDKKKTSKTSKSVKAPKSVAQKTPKVSPKKSIQSTSKKRVAHSGKTDNLSPSSTVDKIPQAKREKVSPINIDLIRQMLSARPITVPQLLKNLTNRGIKIAQKEITEITEIIKQLNPQKSTSKDGKTVLHLKK